MLEKYKEKYRSESARLQTWDYGKDAASIITICTHDIIHFFSKIKNGRIQYSPAIAIAFAFWREIKNHAKNIEFGEFVNIPNHAHGILILNENELYKSQKANTAISGEGRTFRTGHTPPKPDGPPKPHAMQKTIGQQRFQNQGKNTISYIAGLYKSVVTKYCNLLNLPNDWQTRFHDHVTYDEKSFQRISEYIINPINWPVDQFSKYIR